MLDHLLDHLHDSPVIVPEPIIETCHQCGETSEDLCGACSRCRDCCDSRVGLNAPAMIKSTHV